MRARFAAATVAALLLPAAAAQAAGDPIKPLGDIPTIPAAGLVPLKVLEGRGGGGRRK